MRNFALGVTLWLASCSATEPCRGLACLKDEAVREQYRVCVIDKFNEYREEIQAGFYNGTDLAIACRRWAERRVR